MRLPERELVWTGPYLRSCPWADRSWGQLAMLPTHCIVLVCSTTDMMDSEASLKSSNSSTRPRSSHSLDRDFRKSWYLPTVKF